MEPLHSGTYPPVIVNKVKERLPRFSRSQSLMVKGSYDFVGLNYYTSTYAANIPCPAESQQFSQTIALDLLVSHSIKPCLTFYWTFFILLVIMTHLVSLASALRNGVLIGPKVIANGNKLLKILLGPCLDKRLFMSYIYKTKIQNVVKLFSYKL
jgi:hypothetical protein